MQSILSVFLLTISQALLIAALPRWRHVHGQGLTETAQSQTSTLDGSQSILSSQSQSMSDDSTATATTTTITDILNPGQPLVTITITSLPVEQSPTITSATGDSPDTSGSLISTLESSGHPGSQPFPTSIPTVTESTLQPLNTTAPFQNATNTALNSTATNTITVPLTTLETVVSTTAITSIPVATNATITQTTVVNTTYTSEGSLITSSFAGTTVVTTSATGLSEVTIIASSTVTGTISTTLTTVGSVTGLPTSEPVCRFTLGCSGQNVFKPIAVGPPASQIPQRSGHPMPRLGINSTGPIETNKFYSNAYLGSQGQPIFTVPYTLTWSKGTGNAQSWGMAVSHLENSQKVFGPSNRNIPTSPASYYINPLAIQSLILSAAELGQNTVMTSDSIAQFSANVNLLPVRGSTSSITFPLTQGMGFVTALYRSLQPAIQSSIFFRSVTAADSPKPNVHKYRVVLEDGKTWLIYAMPSNGLPPNFKLISSTLLQGVSSWSGTIQIAKLPSPISESLYDDSCGVYATGGSVAGYASGSQSEYGMSWTKSGQNVSDSELLMFALPHHIQSFSQLTSSKVVNLTLDTTVKGTATAVIADYWVMTENDLPVSMGFAPWRPGQNELNTMSAEAVSVIQQVAPIEASQDMDAQSDLDSMYYSGKALSKFASIIYVMNDLVDQKPLAAAALVQLKNAFSRFRDNRQKFPLLYDTDWKGIVSSASYVTGDAGVDFGNSYYNDHHFHYGYFIHAAAVIGYLDPSWLTDNKDYVSSLVRDVSNPSVLDQYFPVSRSFDWYHGHSWAKGLFESGDGKDQESSSEDAMFSFAVKTWGQTTGDKSMEARGNLMLAVQARSFNNYFLLQSSNLNQPQQFVGNKVTGILFENKVDHTTYFGANIEYIQGIHMLPLEPFSTLTRSKDFVQQEWNTYFADGMYREASSVEGGWKGVLYANLAIIDPVASYEFFTQPNFDPSWLDGGASKTWYMAYAASLGGVAS